MHVIKFKNLFLIRPFKISIILIILATILALVMGSIENNIPLRELFRAIGITGVFVVIGIIATVVLGIPSELLDLKYTTDQYFGLVNIQSALGWVLGFLFLYFVVFVLSIVISIAFELLKFAYFKIKQK